MKNILYTSLGLLLLTLSSCNDFLTADLKGDYTSENYYTSAGSATMSVNAIYNSLYGTTLWIFGDVASDDAVKGGNAGDQADINSIDNFSATSDNGVLSTFWQSAYETIARANNSIANIEQMSFDKTLKNRLIGEAKFLRAYSYFNLVNIFGEVPLKTSSDQINVPLSTTSAIYKQIESDLTEAIDPLPASYSSEKGRVTKGAAYALLAKVDLYQNKYSECVSNIDLLQALNQYDLVKDYANLFKSGAEDSVEVIFGIRYVNNDEVSLGNNLTVWFAPTTEGGYYFDAPTQSFVDAFSEKTADGSTDPRLDASIGRDGEPWFNNTTFSSSWSEATGYLVKKYDQDDVTGLSKSQSTVPYHIIRYADVLLMKAEALVELGSEDDLTLAAEALNKVRVRAGLATTEETTQNGLRTVIRNERRKELGFEFHRFFDLMRWGEDATLNALGSDFPWTDPRFYFPIPQAEIDANQALQ
ncbi:MAG: RagB/SusD family nutrient uptake outer membrane protein [Paludibacter sp.]|nr:RagB/SusD family nutrient uptake outer membrane protein [Paludibacter sp.]